jgi:hypothetical protein
MDPAHVPQSSAWILDHLLEIGIVVLVAEIFDIVITLRAFRSKEAEEKLRSTADLVAAPRVNEPHIKACDDRFGQRM